MTNNITIWPYKGLFSSLGLQKLAVMPNHERFNEATPLRPEHDKSVSLLDEKARTNTSEILDSPTKSFCFLQVWEIYEKVSEVYKWGPIEESYEKFIMKC